MNLLFYFSWDIHPFLPLDVRAAGSWPFSWLLSQKLELVPLSLPSSEMAVMTFEGHGVEKVYDLLHPQRQWQFYNVQSGKVQ